MGFYLPKQAKKPITSIQDVAANDTIKLVLQDGTIEAEIKYVNKNKIKEIETQIEILEANELSFDDQIKLFQTTKKKIDKLNNEIELKTAQIKELEAQ